MTKPVFPGLKFHSVAGEGILPTRAHEGDVGVDLYISEDVTVEPGQGVDVPHAVAVELPAGTWGMLVGRSSTIRQRRLLVNLGVIDCGYRGELYTYVTNLHDRPVLLRRGERISQLLVLPSRAELTPFFATALGMSSRGLDGFGSSGV